ncbi:DUF883 family protein [Pandoraea pnomenusa]|uniref:DUF883 family protein n=1 Tax=Pandoraea pnomenusa TaxID=93220 RepID=UPI001146FFC0|nr:DUF883 family protein [Pandoraea pnomenusa]QDH59866.1 DUF883 family protein [Pandoraea pnomenusa]QDX21835.1 DUF883 family protein [Pandoraea pnomenusa]
MNDIRQNDQHDRQTLINDADALLADVKAFLKDLAEHDEAGVAERPAFGARLRELNSHLDSLRHTSRETAARLARTTDGYVHEHPWKSVAAAASIAALAGVAGAMTIPMIARRQHKAASEDVRL